MRWAGTSGCASRTRWRHSSFFRARVVRWRARARRIVEKSQRFISVIATRRQIFFTSSLRRFFSRRAARAQASRVRQFLSVRAFSTSFSRAETGAGFALADALRGPRKSRPRGMRSARNPAREWRARNAHGAVPARRGGTASRPRRRESAGSGSSLARFDARNRRVQGRFGDRACGANRRREKRARKIFSRRINALHISVCGNRCRAMTPKGAPQSAARSRARCQDGAREAPSRRGARSVAARWRTTLSGASRAAAARFSTLFAAPKNGVIRATFEHRKWTAARANRCGKNCGARVARGVDLDRDRP
jgi:hypothetical protein